MKAWKRLAAAVAMGAMALSGPMKARGASRDGSAGSDQAGVFRTLVIEPDRPAGDVACLFCTVLVRGRVNGDLAVLFSTVRVEDGQEIRGDVAGLFSSLRLDDGSTIDGDLAWALGQSSVGDGAQVHGDRQMFGSGVSLAVLLAPLLLIAGFVWLLVWLVRRMV